MKILIADDNQEVRLILKSLIEKIILPNQNTSFSDAESADEAISRLRRGEEYDAVIIDYDMPANGEGLAVVAITRERLPKARIALMSGRMDVEIGNLAAHAGADVALSKPANAQQWSEFLTGPH